MKPDDKNMGERMAALEQKVDDLKEDVGEIKQTIKDFISEADKKYAPKWVATFIYGLVAGGALWILQAILDDLGIK